ncbi:hyaluronoglucosaminidase [Oesophagostomum dentatum]|uniref:Hyaluronoglucosaminidase n=1 Tax=Oesophagostomum dentatum TaxID=61180 RepID=A0A0B1S3D5_OESDE|nr:hyaluronoglucosaminidase [Oesophagostomum dentatum]
MDAGTEKAPVCQVKPPWPQWRIPYNDEEAAILKSLIEAAKANNITFVYSLSPGIDIEYSNVEERICIKSKLDQVRRLGCESFALLFDDIECEMTETDRQCFSSFAAAQVSFKILGILKEQLIVFAVN